MEEGVREILYETRHHASRSCSPSYPPQHTQLNKGVKGSLLSLLSYRGVGQLKRKWSDYRSPRKLRKCISLFVSPRGDRVAVAIGNDITILQKDDDYQQPCGFFTSNSLDTFTNGVWSEPHDVLGVVDDANIVYFVKANGEEITRITKANLKGSSSIVGLIAPDGSYMNKSCLCIFNVLTSDGSLHEVEISQDPSASILSARTSNNGSILKEFPANVFCLDYHPEIFLLAVVGAPVSGSTGPCNLSLWRRTNNLCLDLVFSTQLAGLYSKPTGYIGQLTAPKVLLSPEGKFVAALDLRGHLIILKLDNGQFSLSNPSFGDNSDAQVSNVILTSGRESIQNIIDFTWWSDHILALATRCGIVTMIDIFSGIKLLEDPLRSMIILERVQQVPGRLFLLQTTSKILDSSNMKEASDLELTDLVTEDEYNQSDIAKLCWSLLSFSNRSVSEMYDVLIGEQKYQSALDFADRYGLDRDEVLKSQWLHSVQEVNEINIFLSVIKDQVFVLSECMDRVGPTEEAVRALISHGLHLTYQYRFSTAEINENRQIWDFRLARLKLLQFRDKLETFIGINMGRFSVQEYNKFRHMHLNEVAVTLAESGKIGALNLLFKRHSYSLTPFMLEILAAIPETVPVQSYGQLLPGNSPPSNIALRENDWVECEEMVTFISKLPENYEGSIHLRTEPIIKLCLGFSWPSTNELSVWYKSRARNMDSLSGQLDNCLSLIDFACRKGIYELKPFHQDLSYLQQIIYYDGTDDEVNLSTSLVEWEQLSDYEKFKMMLRGVKQENVVERLHETAIPFMQNRFHIMTSVSEDVMDEPSAGNKKAESFLVRWLKEIASENKLDISLKVIEEGCKDSQSRTMFEDKAEAVDCVLQCIYMCTSTSRWSTMASILSKLPKLRDSEVYVEGLNERLKMAEGHIEAGRLLSLYQIPKPLYFFLESHSDGKGVKQILRLVLSKFVRRQPGHSDNDWANLWRDLQSLRENAFPFLDQEYMLMEFCRGLMKAGKFSLARNYLRGTASVALATDKAENLVIQAAREYFFSASSLTGSEVWKARECLNLFPGSRNVKAEADMIDALTVKLPNLGVNILPVQFRQIKDPMDIVKLAITSQVGAYLNVDEIIEVAKLLGLSSQDDMSAVQEAIAREAAVAGDLQLAFDLCLVLAKTGHGSIWDLCAAMARGRDLENIDITFRKQLLGFALSHCDEESIGELLHAWKDLDMQVQCEKLMILSGTDPPKFSVHGSSIISSVRNSEDMVDPRHLSEQVDGAKCEDQELHIRDIRNILAVVAKDLSKENDSSLETLLWKNGKISSFVALQLPWLLELSHEDEHSTKLTGGLVLGKPYIGVRTQAVVAILSWLAQNDFAPRDDLIASLAKSVMKPPVGEEEDIMGSSFLLNLLDAFHGVEIIEEQVRTREAYNEICSIMSVGMIYSLLHNSTVDSHGPSQRRELLLKKFREKHTSLTSDELDKIDRTQASFWRDWKLKLEEQKHVADHSRVLEQIIPGVETVRFLSGDIDYIESVVFSLVESVKIEKKHILKDILKLANIYDLNRAKVFLCYLSSVLVSEVWALDDITAEISEYKNEILAHAEEAIKTISLSVYPVIQGHDKQRLSYMYGFLSDCYLQLEGTSELMPTLHPNLAHLNVDFARFYKVVEQECSRVSFIKNLNFKNIAGLGGLNFKFFTGEIYAHIDECSVEALATMVQSLVGIYRHPMPEALINGKDVYRYHVLCLLQALEDRVKVQAEFESHENLHALISELEKTYNDCGKYVRVMTCPDVLDMVKQIFKVITPLNRLFEGTFADSTGYDSLIFLLNFWLRVIDDMMGFTSHESSQEKFNLECLMCCLKVFTRLVIEGRVSPKQSWDTFIGYVSNGLKGSFSDDVYIFCKSMCFSGCGFGAIAEVYSEAVSQLQSGSGLDTERHCRSIQDLLHLYSSILETVLENLASGSLDRQNLHHLMSSLSRTDGDLEDLNRVRHAVWEKMIKFCDNLMLPSHVRVYVLELMQFISDSGRNVSTFSAELKANVLPWEEWDDSISIATKNDIIANYGVQIQSDTSNRLTTTLVALKSSQLVLSISPSIEISPQDLSTVDSAVACFIRLCGETTFEPHVDALIAILGEWEGLFTIKWDQPDSALVSAAAANDWDIDVWDEGWESFPEETGIKESLQADSLLVHPLHLCWMEILKKLVTLSRFRDLLKLIDQSVVKSSGVLLDRVGAHSLAQILLGIDCFVALKLALSFPYEELRLQCLDAIEDKLKHGGASDAIVKDHEILVLVLSSGIVSTIMSGSKYGTTFSFLCYMIGSFSRQYQETQLSKLKQKVRTELKDNDSNLLFLFGRFLFPCFVSELVKADQKILAGFLVTKFMHTNASLSLINVAEASLKMFFERQLQILHVDECSNHDVGFGEPLGNTISKLRCRLGNLIQSALSSLTTDVR